MATATRQHPSARYESDEDVMGRRKMDTYVSSNGEVNSSDISDTWRRLYNGRTLSSLRREVTYFDRDAPRDSLDFHLKAQYNNHREFLKDTNEVVLQRETLGDQGTRTLKNRAVIPERVEPQLGHPLRTVCYERKGDKNSVKNSISGHHTQTTNVGYSRKPDGGFYTS